jgi:Tfp pilus assembly protein PilV
VRPTPARHPPSREAGFALIEVLVSALVVVITGGAVLSLLQATTRSAGDERRHATAFALAQEDQSRLRTSRLSTLNQLQETRTVDVGGQQFTVESTGVFVNNGTGTASCTEGYESADYAKVSSTVTWPGIGARKPVTIDSIVSPSSGSLDPSHGTLTISATNAAGVPLAGVSLSGTGPSAFSGSTDESGCANFADLPEGNYTLTSSAGGMIDEYGNTVGNRTVGVVGSTTVTIPLRFDIAGGAVVALKNRVGTTESFEAAEVDSLFLYHPELSEGGKAIGDPGGPRQSEFEIESLFPFTSPYTVYAGSCASNNPNPDEEEGAPGEAAMAGLTITPGGTAEGTVLQVPALYVTVTNGSTPLKNATVVISDDECKEGGSYVQRSYTTNEDGQQSSSEGTVEPALPWGRYNVCATAFTSGAYRRQREYDVDVKSLANGIYVSLNLTGSGSQSSSKASNVSCP